ncbi:hypothetical protein pEaSNUABM40_00181 [Erwinia phage pEa_SNUABM_40]|uniref:Uncharacterized protein n=1 Tax=Erwinia phage pEa_SNUABM_3 TaxID=2869552 RepID=A0AAE7XJ85_9CAUD|nr:DNA helicase [Erwinia phage pEa_SNUABM_3]QZE56714.1 hypothetical protein pEaSNUABM20_00178 [Erwinia phage pEa_SNUABM_20]QZE58397.1 hypothetical protein pEaSNUABM40_00181 [Erwinia phage pEa_SNUABM_40]UAW52959.1 hypothetical protein pEaSNUABM23_00177 [Erwinia phage pEa_SNUABM_23]UIW10855.1 hypothetical protein pEaSNUABM23_00177 [Erwinia phage pEa_SNUABM_31]QZE56375.1 hypothetical protein pEaSNUABM3_00178 [Erwinia phage pEa_SNUABM_3]
MMNQVISTSATATQQIADSFSQALAIRPLPPEFDGKMSKMYATGKSRRNYETLAVFTASTVARIYAAFDLINYIVTNGAEFEDMLEVSPDDFTKRIKNNIEAATLKINVMLNDSKLTREIKSSLAEHLSASSGAIVENSTRFPGGKDIIMSGTPCPTSPLASNGNFNILNNQGSDRPRVDNDGTFERANLQTYSADIAQAAIRMAKTMYKDIFGVERNNSNVFDTKMVRIPLDKDWTVYNAALRSIHPSMHNLDIDLFRNLDKQVVDGLGDFMTIGIRSIPGKAMIDRKIQAMKISHDTPVDFNEVALATDVRVEGGLIVNFEKEMVEYISQGAATQTMCLYRWFQGWASYYFRVANSTRTGITRAARIPRYVTSATSLPELKKLREKFNYVVNDVVADEHGMTIMPNGTMAVLPRREDIDVDMVKTYETSLNGVLEDLFEKGIPLSTEHDTLRTNMFAIQNGNLDYDREVQAKAKSLTRFSDVCIGIDPDFALVVNTSNGGGLSVNETRTVGMKAPTSLDVADALGYDFAEPGEAPNFRSVSNVIGNIYHNQASGGMALYRTSFDTMVEAAKVESGSGKLVESVSESTIKFNSPEGSNLPELVNIIAQTCQTYEFMLKSKQVPDLKTLVENARKAVGMDAENASLSESSMDNGLYENLIGNDFSVPDMSNERPALTMLRIMLRVLNDAAGLRGSNLIMTSLNEMGSITAATESLPNHTHYFVMGEKSKLSDMARLNNYFGGALYREMANSLVTADRKKLFSSLIDSDQAPGSGRLQQIILPFATMYSDVIPKSLEIFESAENEIERLKPDSGITIDDIRIPGLKDGAALLPHQVEAHKTLRRRPRFATIFIAPGGGKTIIGLSDIAALIKELDDLGEETIRPLIICPSNLVANWCDDLHKIVDGWNAVPITADTVNTWGEERMYDVISQAPRNTIYIVGLSFLQTGTFNVDIGGVRVRVRGAVEFVNRFRFSYVLLDESHKVKNFSGGQAGSQVHFNTKAVFTAPSVRYARIATGTLVTDRVRDIVGQAALMTPAMFGDSLDVAYDGAKDDIEMIRRAHSRMANHTAFISFKRKHWAFMLPNPIDTFIQVEIDDPSVPNSALHQEVYNAMYAEVLEKLDEAARNAKKSKSSDDEDDETGGGDNENATDIDEDDIEEGDDLGALLAGNADLNMYFQRMEMMLTDPMGDDVARLTFEAAGVNNFVSAKVLTIIDRIKKHFEVQPERDIMVKEQQIFEWKPGVQPRELDIAVYNGQKYLARKQSEEFQRQDLPPSMTPPPDDPDYWKPEVQGKLIVFTRYVRAANAIYNALPANYKKVAVVYHGEVGKLGQNKDANLDAFKTDPNVQILIANEQAISEGHNMQMGSRIIRCDTPWSPGTYDQSTARIFRPDVAAAKLDENGKPGDMAREVVFIDWVMTNKTLEVGKVARLMWKTLEKTRFDEKGNKRYEALDQYKLDPIKMSPSLLLDNNTMKDFEPYFLAKRDLNEIESQEFQEMRRTTVAAMQALPSTPALNDFRVMEQTPFVANQKIPDRHGWGLERILDWARNRNFASGENLKDSLNRAPVVTEYGNGLIVSVTARMVDGKLRADSPISTVRVRLAGTGETVSIPATKVHIATKVDKADLKRFFEQRKPWANEKDRKRANAEANRVEVEDTVLDETQTADTKETEKKVEAQARKAARVAQRKQNKEEGKPINEGVEEAAKKVRRRKAADLPPLANTTTRMKPGAKAVAEATGSDMALELTPTVYNGFVALYADATDPDAKALKEFDFVEFGDYVYYDCAYYADFEALLDFIEVKKKLSFDRMSEKRLEFVLDFFDESTPRMGFNVKLATKGQEQLPKFFLVKHKSASDKNHIKAYPMVMEDRLRIMFDLKTNPKMKRFVGTKIPNTRKFGTFDQAPGMWIGFVKNVATAKSRINKIVKAGYTITNIKRVTTALDKLKLTMSKNKSV